MIARRSQLLLAIVGFMLLLGATPSHASGNAYSSLQADWLWRVQELLYEAAVNGEKWETDREQIDLHIKHIGYALQQAVVAEYWSDLPKAKAYLREAITLLREGVDRGYFRLPDVKPVMALVDAYRHVIKV